MFQIITSSFLAKFIDGPQKTSRQFSNHSKVERMIIRHGHLDAMYLFVSYKMLGRQKAIERNGYLPTKSTQTNPRVKKSPLRVAEHAGNPSKETITFMHFNFKKPISLKLLFRAPYEIFTSLC